MEREPSFDWRARGVVLVAAGLFLDLLIAAVAWHVAPGALAPGVEVDGTTFTGTPAQGRLLLGFLALVGLFGALCVASGIHMIATGRRSRRAAGAGLALFLLLCAFGLAIRRGLV
jgi:uncharacterized membrane protein HdeD (DUF308 family)